MRGPIVILTECGSEKGMGHLTRCHSLAQAFRELGREVLLWVAADEWTGQCLPAGARSFPWYEPDAGSADELARASAVVVDSYAVTMSQVGRIAGLNPNFAVIDDFMRRDYRRGIVVDWTLGAEKFAYSRRNPGVLYLLGSRYCALRPEFWLPFDRECVAPPQSVLVSFGGSDVRGLTAPVVEMLQREFPSLQKHVIVGAGVRERSFLSALRSPCTHFHVACDAFQMRAAMEQADMAICAGGQTLYELASRGLPPVVVEVADNQEDDAREFGQLGFAQLAGSWSHGDLLSRIAACLRGLWPAQVRRARAGIGVQSVNSHGARLLAGSMSERWRQALLK